MGCASSSPLVNGGAPAGIVDSAKSAATEVISSGENALNELGENITETAGQVKETMEEAVNGMANSIGGVIHDGITKIPLKETMNSANHLMEENMENLKNEMMNKAQSIGDETDKIADELIKDTEDVIRDAETGILDIKNNAVETVQTVKNDIVDGINLKSPTHSVDFNQASVPEPEIEKLLKEEDIPTSPKATVDELVNLRMNIEEEKEEEFPPTTQEEFNVATNVEEPSREATPVKIEDELVVEDIKDENHLMVERPRKLLKTAAFEEPEDSSEYDVSTEGSQDINEPTSKTQWEELQEFYFKMGIKRALNASMESLMEDEDACKINLSNLYRESSSQLSVKSNEPAKSDDTVAVIEKLLKSFEQENNLTDSTTDLKTEETPNSLIEEKEINEKEMIEIACEENKINEDLSEENFEKIDIEIDNKIIEENLEKIDTEIESKINEFETEVINIDKETKLIENEENVNVDDQVVKDSINDDNFQNVLVEE